MSSPDTTADRESPTYSDFGASSPGERGWPSIYRPTVETESESEDEDEDEDEAGDTDAESDVLPPPGPSRASNGGLRGPGSSESGGVSPYPPSSLFSASSAATVNTLPPSCSSVLTASRPGHHYRDATWLDRYNKRNDNDGGNGNKTGARGRRGGVYFPTMAQVTPRASTKATGSAPTPTLTLALTQETRKQKQKSPGSQPCSTSSTPTSHTRTT